MHGVPSWRFDLYTRNHFLESMGSRFGGPGQKALQAMNEFTLLWIFALSLYPRPVPLTYQPRSCKDGFISIVFDLSPLCRLFDRSIIGHLIGHLILEMSMRKAFIWLSGLRFIAKLLMARNFFRFSLEIIPHEGPEKKIFPTWWLIHPQVIMFCPIRQNIWMHLWTLLIQKMKQYLLNKILCLAALWNLIYFVQIASLIFYALINWHPVTLIPIHQTL